MAEWQALRRPATSTEQDRPYDAPIAETDELRATTTDGASLKNTLEQPETSEIDGRRILQVERLRISAPPASLLPAKPQAFA